MSDPVVKGAKRSVHSAPHSTGLKSSTKQRNPINKAAQHKSPAERTQASKTPVREAVLAKNASSHSKNKTKRSTGVAAKTKPGHAAQSKTAAQSTTKGGAQLTPKKVKTGSEERVSKAQLAASASGKQPVQAENTALRLFERAHQEFAQGHLSEARTMFQRLIEQHAGVIEIAARARTYLAVVEARLRTETALPKDADALYDRGVVALNRSQYEYAQEMFERALKRKPNAAYIHYGLAITHARLGSTAAALGSLQQALELDASLRLRASHDADLASIRNEPDFESLVLDTRS